MYREIQNLDQKLLPEILNMSQNFSLSESSRMTIDAVIFLPVHPESRTHIFALGLTF